MAYNTPVHLLFASISSGESFPIPSGFITASINPASSSSYTITNGLGDIGGLTTGVSASTSSVFTFPVIGDNGWAQHTIICTAGSLEIFYATGK